MRRDLAVSETRDDRSIVADLKDVAGPSRIHWCSLDDVLAGFQVFYGLYNPIAGKQHGDLSVADTCEQHLLVDEVHQVSIYKQSNPVQIVGMSIKFKNYSDTEVD